MISTLYLGNYICTGTQAKNVIMLGDNKRWLRSPFEGVQDCFTLLFSSLGFLDLPSVNFKSEPDQLLFPVAHLSSLSATGSSALYKTFRSVGVWPGGGIIELR